MLEALYRLAHQEELMGDPDYEIKPVAWLVRVGDGGQLLGIEGTHQAPPAEGKKKSKPQPKAFAIPRQPTGRSGTKAPSAFFVDNAKYVFGKSTKDKTFSAEEGLEKSGWFRDIIDRCAKATNDPGTKAVAAFLDRIRSGEEEIRLPEECKSNDLFAFIYAPDIDLLVHQRPAVREYWKEQRSGSTFGGSRYDCLITGAPVSDVPLIPLLRRVPGGSSSGVALASFNASAFESHGWRGNENAPISRDASEAISTSLNRLLHPAFPDPRPECAGQTLPTRNFRLSADTVICYWAATSNADGFLDVFAALFNPDDPAMVGEAYQSLWRGRPVDLKDPSRFYALTITGTQGRAIIRDWFESSVADVTVNLARYFDDLSVVRNVPRPKGRELPPQIPLRVLLASLAPLGKSENIAAPLAAQFVHAALRGAPFPLAVLQKAVERARAEVGRTDWSDLDRRDARAALIKAVLRRNYSRKEISPAMDPTNSEPGYLLGRLMAVLERLQQAALGDVNASVIDRFFGAASATPQAVFPRLLKNARHHARKALDDAKSKGLARWLEGEIDDILAPLTVQIPRQGMLHTGFPAHLALEQQALFVLGYHHERHWIWLSNEERERLTAERRESVAAIAR